MVQTPTKPLTLEEFLSLPETKPASEYISGQIRQKPMPKGKHSRLQEKLSGRINLTLETDGIAIAFPELRCTFGGRSIVPDIAVFCQSRIPTDEIGNIADLFSVPPDWSIEILFPNQSGTKVIDNLLHCLNHGCGMGWLLDPAEQAITAYPKDQQPVYLSDPEARLPVPAFATPLELTIGQVFSWLRLQ
jgi:Uma2 family endonuclease